tara:strand:+ start:1487 stop:1597 length:111 start_codon:yes stop_codon:yes gene_type:complete
MMEPKLQKLHDVIAGKLIGEIRGKKPKKKSKKKKYD